MEKDKDIKSLLPEITEKAYTEALLTSEDENLEKEENKKIGKIENLKNEFNEAKTEKETMDVVLKAETSKLKELEEKLEFENSEEEVNKIKDDIKICKENIKELNKLLKEPKTKIEEKDEEER